MTTSLTLTHLRIDLVARTRIKLGGHLAGDRLRNALAATMLRLVCLEPQNRGAPGSEHASQCPVCWLLAADVDPGQVRRAYSLIPPLGLLDVVKPGERFSFGLTLAGEALRFLPYFVLALPQMGAAGVGPGRGGFQMEAIWAQSSSIGGRQAVVRPGANMVHVPQASMTWDTARRAALRLSDELKRNGRLSIRFITPTRLIDRGSLVRTPDFGVFFRRLLERIDHLREQYAGEPPRGKDEIALLYGVADRVRLMDCDVRWVDFFSWSGRTRRHSPMGGFVGRADYASRDWDPLLPWLIFGQGAQVGKLTSKGNGLFEILAPGIEPYWNWMRRKEVVRDGHSSASDPG